MPQTRETFYIFAKDQRCQAIPIEWLWYKQNKWIWLVRELLWRNGNRDLCRYHSDIDWLVRFCLGALNGDEREKIGLIQWLRFGDIWCFNGWRAEEMRKHSNGNPKIMIQVVELLLQKLYPADFAFYETSSKLWLWHPLVA
jgi:hypothetical protein